VVLTFPFIFFESEAALLNRGLGSILITLDYFCLLTLLAKLMSTFNCFSSLNIFFLALSGFEAVFIPPESGLP